MIYNYRILAICVNNGAWKSFGVAYTENEMTLLFVPMWRSPKRSNKVLEELDEAHFPKKGMGTEFRWLSVKHEQFEYPMEILQKPLIIYNINRKFPSETTR